MSIPLIAVFLGGGGMSRVDEDNKKQDNELKYTECKRYGDPGENYFTAIGKDILLRKKKVHHVFWFNFVHTVPYDPLVLSFFPPVSQNVSQIPDSALFTHLQFRMFLNSFDTAKMDSIDARCISSKRINLVFLVNGVSVWIANSMTRDLERERERAHRLDSLGM